MPTITLPDVKLPDVKLPDFDFGSVGDRAREEAGNLDTPRVTIPKVDLPRMEVPRVDLPHLELPSIRDIRRSAANEIDPRPSIWPVIGGVAIVGLLVGWMLAMSPVTGPRIRSAISDLRDRLDAWRSGDVDWRDLDQGEAAVYAEPMTPAMGSAPSTVASDPWTSGWSEPGVDADRPTPVAQTRPSEGLGTD